MNLNQVNIIGRVTRDPEVKALPSGASVASFSLATNRVYKDADGKKVENVDFHNVVAFGKVVDAVIRLYVKKGQLIYVGGRLQTRSWEDKNSGEKKYRTEIVLETLQLGPRAGASGPREDDPDASVDEAFDTAFGTTEPDEGSPTAQRRAAAKKSVVPKGSVPLRKVDGATDDINPDDIPF